GAQLLAGCRTGVGEPAEPLADGRRRRLDLARAGRLRAQYRGDLHGRHGRQLTRGVRLGIRRRNRPRQLELVSNLAGARDTVEEPPDPGPQGATLALDADRLGDLPHRG